MTYQQPRSGDMALLRKKAQVQAARARIEAEARERERQAATQQNERIDAAKRVNAATQAMLAAKTSPATIRRQQLEKRVDDAAKQADAALRVANGKRNMRLVAARKLVAEEAARVAAANTQTRAAERKEDQPAARMPICGLCGHDGSDRPLTAMHRGYPAHPRCVERLAQQSHWAGRMMH